MKGTRHLLRSLRSSTIHRAAQSSLTTSRRLAIIPTTALAQPLPHRTFSTTTFRPRGLQPDSSDPSPPKTEPGTDSSAGAAQISDAEYHEIADQYLNTLVLALEELAESNSEGVEAEFSVRIVHFLLQSRYSLAQPRPHEVKAEL
jgi:frataxin